MYNTYSTRWVPRCPDNPDPLYDNGCNIQYNYERFVLNPEKSTTCLGATLSEELSQYPCRNFQCLTQLISNYNSFVNANANYTSFNEFWQLLKHKESAYNALFVRYTEQGLQDSMIMLLNLENNEQNRERRIQFTLHQGLFLTARSQVSTLPTSNRDEIDRVVLWQIVIDKAEQDTAFVFMPDQKTFVEELAYDNRLYTPWAQALLTACDGRIFEPVQPDLSGGNVKVAIGQVSDLKLFPNPSTGYVSIELTGINLNKPAEYKVFNTIGETKASGNINEETKTLDFNHLQPGAYNIQLNTTDGAILHSRFIIIK